MSSSARAARATNGSKRVFVTSEIPDFDQDSWLLSKQLFCFAQGLVGLVLECW